MFVSRLMLDRSKSGIYRDVPIQTQIIELGFLDFVKGKAEGPLFLYPDYQDGLKAARDLSGRLTQWVREQDLIGKDVSPHHDRDTA